MIADAPGRTGRRGGPTQKGAAAPCRADREPQGGELDAGERPWTLAKAAARHVISKLAGWRHRLDNDREAGTAAVTELGDRDRRRAIVVPMNCDWAPAHWKSRLHLFAEVTAAYLSWRPLANKQANRPGPAHPSLPWLTGSATGGR